MSKLLDFTKKKGVKKLSPKQKLSVSGGDLVYTSYASVAIPLINLTNTPPKQKPIIVWGQN